MVLLLLLTGCRGNVVYTASDIMKIGVEQYSLTCTPLSNLPDEQMQCFHISMLMESSSYANCYNTAMSFSVTTHQISNYDRDESRRLNRGIIIDCADSKANMPLAESDQNTEFINAVGNTLYFCNVCRK